MLTSGSKPSPPSFPLAALAVAMALACGVLPLAVDASPRAAFDDLLAASSPAILDVSARLNPTTTATSQLAPVFDSHPGLHLGLSTPAHLSYDPPRLPRPPAFRFGGRLHASHALTHHLALRPTPLPPLLSHAFSTYDLTRTLSHPDHHNPISDPTLFAYDPTHLLPQPSRAPLGPIDSPNLYQAFGLDPMNMTDPLGLLRKPLIGFIYELSISVDGEVLRYVGSARDLKQRFSTGKHKWEEIIRHQETRIRMKRVRGQLSIGLSGQGTELSARHEALGSVEKLELDRAKRSAARHNANLAPGKEPIRVLNDDPIVSSEPRRASWQETHNVSVSRRWETVKNIGESFDVSRLPEGAAKLRAGISRFAGLYDVYSTVREAWSVVREGQLSQFEMAPYVLEDEDGAFAFGIIEGRLGSETYYKEYCEGSRSGEREEILRADFREYLAEAEALFGYVDWQGRFVPGLLNPFLPCANCS